MSELLPCPLCASTDLCEGVAYPHASSAKEPAMMCCECSCRSLKSHWQKRPVGWQPIATAPKDGTKVLAYWAGDNVITYWAERVGFAGWQPPAMMPIRVGDKSAWNPTHWMPLPPAPEAQP